MVDVTFAEPFQIRPDPDGKMRWLLALTAAFLVHMCVLTFVINRAKTAEPDASPPMALDMAALPESIAKPNAAPIEEPHPAVVQEQVETTPAPPPPVVVPVAPAPTVFVEQKAPAKPQPVKKEVHKRKIIVKKTVAATATASAEAPQAARNAAQARGVSAHVSNVSNSNWRSQVMSRLLQAKRYPARARWKSEEDRILASISVGSDGTLQVGRVLRSKGYAELDDEVSDLVRRVGHVPPPPGGAITITVAFEFTLQ